MRGVYGDEDPDCLASDGDDVIGPALPDEQPPPTLPKGAKVAPPLEP